LKRIVTVLTATALMVVLMAATAAPAFADGYAFGQCDGNAPTGQQKECKEAYTGTDDPNADAGPQQKDELWGWGPPNKILKQDKFKHDTVY
jgi:hypothetical protein